MVVENNGRMPCLYPETSIMTRRWLVPAIIAVLVMIAGPVSASNSCPLCSPTGTTLAGEVAQADLIIYGTLSNRKHD